MYACMQFNILYPNINLKIKSWEKKELGYLALGKQHLGKSGFALKMKYRM